MDTFTAAFPGTLDPGASVAGQFCVRGMLLATACTMSGHSVALRTYVHAPRWFRSYDMRQCVRIIAPPRQN